MSYRILVAEDEVNLRNVITKFFREKEFIVDAASDGLEAIDLIYNNKYDIILLDIMMPGLDGMEVCRKIRGMYDVPIIFVTAVVDDESKIIGYNMGADDYITKPFSFSVLYAKVMVLLKRYFGELVQNGLIRLNGIEINPAKRQVICDGKEVIMPPKEYELLMYLVENKNQVLSREQILDRVWGEDYFGYDRAVDTHIKKLRACLGERGKAITTVSKAGYVWKE